MPIEIQTGVGRIVWGTPGKAQTKKDQQKQVIMKEGKPVMQWAFGVAFPKAEFGAIWQAMDAEVKTAYPNGVPSKFSWKFLDGDSVDQNGQPYNLREGYAGCYVLTISTEAFAPPIYKLNGAQFVQVPPEGIKCGDFVALALKLKVNVPQDRTHTPGLFVNPVAINHIAYGAEINNGPDANALFGNKQYALPPGASATPVAPTNAPGMPGTNPGNISSGPAGMPGYAPQPGMMPAPQR